MEEFDLRPVEQGLRGEFILWCKLGGMFMIRNNSEDAPSQRLIRYFSTPAVAPTSNPSGRGPRVRSPGTTGESKA